MPKYLFKTINRETTELIVTLPEIRKDLTLLELDDLVKTWVETLYQQLEEL